MNNFPELIKLIMLLSIALSFNLDAADTGSEGPPPLPQGSVESLVTGNAAARVCLNNCANNLKQCVNACPEPNVSAENPDIEAPTCMMQCVSNYIGCYDGC